MQMAKRWVTYKACNSCPLFFTDLLQLFQLIDNLGRIQPITHPNIKELPSDCSTFTNDINLGTGNPRIKSIRGIIGTNGLLLHVRKHRVLCLSPIDNLSGFCFIFRTDGDNFRPVRLNRFVNLLQLSELRSTKRSPIPTIKYEHDFLSSCVVSE